MENDSDSEEINTTKKGTKKDTSDNLEDFPKKKLC